MFTEDMGAKRLPRSGYAKDVLEVEGYVRGFARRRPDVAVTMLRAANTVGPTVVLAADPTTSGCRSSPPCSGTTPGCSSCTRTTCSAPSQHATLGGVHGTFNVAGDGV